MNTSFDPNEVLRSLGEWATYVPSRNPEWRVHRRKSDARNAFNKATTVSLFRRNGNDWAQVDHKVPAPKPVEKLVPKLDFTSPRQKAVMRVLLERFEKFAARKQEHYLINGMSTSHLALHVIDDRETIHAFWPAEAQTRDYRHGQIYQLQDGVITKMQSTVRQEIEKLEKKGYIERMGNEHERRWRPAKNLRGVTL